MGKPLQVFCCYAREDQEYLYELKNHLMALQREKLIEIKTDININPGTEWEREISHHLNKADIILLLISADFIASDYCVDQEMRQAIARHQQGMAYVVPVIIRSTSWENMSFGKLQALPKDAKPVATWTHRDEAWVDVMMGIRKVIAQLVASSSLPERKSEALTTAISIPNMRPHHLPFDLKRPFSKGNFGGKHSSQQTARFQHRISRRAALTGLGAIAITVTGISISRLTGTSSTALYRADSNWSGWNMGSEWTLQNGLLMSSAGPNSEGLIFAPYKQKMVNYVVEVQIRYDHPINESGNARFGILIGAGNQPSYVSGENARGYYCAVYSPDTYPFIYSHNVNGSNNTEGIYSLDHNWHIYRAEVRQNGVNFLADGHLLAQTEPTTLDMSQLTGAMGLFAYQGTQISVQNFSVIALADE